MLRRLCRNSWLRHSLLIIRLSNVTAPTSPQRSIDAKIAEHTKLAVEVDISASDEKQSRNHRHHPSETKLQCIRRS